MTIIIFGVSLAVTMLMVINGTFSSRIFGWLTKRWDIFVQKIVTRVSSRVIIYGQKIQYFFLKELFNMSSKTFCMLAHKTAVRRETLFAKLKGDKKDMFFDKNAPVSSHLREVSQFERGGRLEE